MNREIKFRAWDIKGKRMLTPTLFNVKNKTFTAILEKMNKGNWNGNYRFGEVYFMQFTGLHDKNGVPIYEGDVIKINESKLTVQKGYHVLDTVYELKGIDLPSVYGYYAETNCGSWHFNLGVHVLKSEVIGNIYENAELLK